MQDEARGRPQGKAVLWSPKVHSVMSISVIGEALAGHARALADLEQATGLDAGAMHSPATRVSFKQILAAYVVAAAQRDDPLLGWRTGIATRSSYYGMYGFAILSSPDFRQTIQLGIHHQQLSGRLCHLHFEAADSEAIWRCDPFVHPAIQGQVSRCIVENYLGSLLAVHRDVLGPDFQPRALRLTSPGDDRSEEIARQLGIDVIGGAPHNQLVFDPRWLDAKPQFGNAIGHDSVRQACRELEQQQAACYETSSRVWSELVRRYGRNPGAIEMARLLHCSERTLRRNLGNEGTSYRSLSDQVSAQIAMKYLRDTDLNVEAVALTMGYDEPSNFRRAFRRWTGESPTSYREGQRLGQDRLRPLIVPQALRSPD